MEWLKVIADGGAVVAMVALVFIFLKFLRMMIDRFLLSQNEERDRAERIFEKQSDTTKQMGRELSEAIRSHDERSSQQHANITQAIIAKSKPNGK